MRKAAVAHAEANLGEDGWHQAEDCSEHCEVSLAQWDELRGALIDWHREAHGSGRPDMCHLAPCRAVRYYLGG